MKTARAVGLVALGYLLAAGLAALGIALDESANDLDREEVA